MKYLKITTLLYIAVPNLLFLATWFSIPSIWYSLVAFMWVIIRVLKKIMKQAPVKLELPKNYWVVLPLLSLSLCYLFGIGETNTQALDWATNNYKFYDLITHSSPVFYEKEQVYLCYYLGYYLIPAQLAKIFGIIYVKTLVLLWTWVGITLLLIWMYLSIKTKIFIFFIMDGSIFFCKFLFSKLYFFSNYIDTFGFIRSGNTPLFLLAPFYTSLYWGTQHAIVALLGVFFLNRTAKENEDIILDAFFIGSCFFWAPLCSLGLLPFWVIKYLSKWSLIKEWLNLKIIFYLILIIIALAPIGLYLASNEGATNSANKMFLWNTSFHWYIPYSIFILLYVLIWIPLIIKNKAYDKQVVVAIVLLLLAPLFIMGKYNDFLARFSMPAHIVLFLSIVKLFHWDIRVLFKSKHKLVYGLIVFASSFMILKDIYKSIFFPKTLLNTIERPFIGEAKNSLDFLMNVYGKETAQNYRLKQDSYVLDLLKKKEKK